MSVWLLEIQIGGTWRRYAADSLSVTTADGEVLSYWSGLQSDPAAAPGDDRIQVSVVDPTVSWADLHDQLESTQIRLLRWDGESIYELATVYADGLTVGSQYGDRYEPLDVEIDQSYREGAALLPDPLARVDSSTWPITVSPAHEICEDQIGAYYPILLGSPGYVEGSAVPRPVVPCPLAQFRAASLTTSYVVVSDRASDITQVFVADVAAAVSGWQTTVAGVSDLLGRPVTVTDFSTTISGLPGAAADSKRIYAGFMPAYGGGQYRGAYDVIVWLLRTWAGDTRIDWDRMPQAAALNSYQVDTWINAPTAPWAWIESVLLPYLPARIRDGGRGRYLELVPTRADPTASVGSLSADRGDIARQGPVRLVQDGDICNELAADFQRLYWGAWIGRRIISPQSSQLSRTYGLTDERILGSPVCAISESRYGRRVGEPLQLAWTWDASTVLRVLEHQIDRRALPSRQVTYRLAEDGLRTGDVVLITDSEIGLDDTPAIVDEQPVTGPDGTVARLRIPGVT